MVPLQLVGKVPGRDVPFILWDNKVGEPYHIIGKLKGQLISECLFDFLNFLK